MTGELIAFLAVIIVPMVAVGYYINAITKTKDKTDKRVLFSGVIKRLDNDLEKRLLRCHTNEQKLKVLSDWKSIEPIVRRKYIDKATHHFQTWE